MMKILRNLEVVYNVRQFDEVVWVSKPADFRIKAELFDELREELPQVKFVEGNMIVFM